MSRRTMIFDNAFRTILERAPELVVMMINEAFHTDYRFDEPVIQCRNEHVTKAGKIVTDSVLVVRGVSYHVEVQAYHSVGMQIRMIEYDFHIAPGNAEQKDGVYRIKFPESCVFYIRRQRLKNKTLDVEIEFPDGAKVMYKAKARPTLSYTLDDIFEKKLYALIPYYLLKYEKKRDILEGSDKEREELLGDYKEIANRLIKIMEDDSSAGYISVLLDLVNDVADEVLVGQPETRKGLGEIMGGQVMTLASDRMAAEAEARGEIRGGNNMLNKLVQDGKLSIEDAAKEMGVTRKKFLDQMTLCGYKAPDEKSSENE